jgi:hypothetical protein
MRTRLPFLGPAALLVALALALAAPGAAVAATSEQVVTLAESYGMFCEVNGTEVQCSRGTRTSAWLALISPETGPLASLQTDATPFAGPPLDIESHDWMVAMHDLACSDTSGVTDYVDQVAALTKPATIPSAVVGACTMDGSMAPDAQARPVYRVFSKINPPAPPTAPPTVAPTVQPTVAPTAAPPEAPGPTPNPTAAAASAAPSGSPASASPVPSATASPIPSETAMPSPSSAVSPIGGPGSPAPSASAIPTGPPSFADSVVDLSGIATDAASIGGSGLLALLLVLIAFAAELFNNTVENNYSEIAGWFNKGPVGRIRAQLAGANGWARSHTRIAVLSFVALTALVSSFVDPAFGLDLRSLAEFLGFLVGLIVVLASFKLPPMLAHRRKTGELGNLRPLPWALVIAAVFVLVSRVGNLQPGYLYGIVLGAIFTREVSDDDEGKETVYGSIWTIVASIVAWVLLTWVRFLGFPAADFGNVLIQTALAAILVAGLEATAFGLMPLRFMPGYAIYRWNRPAWAVLFAISVFAFIHILIGPSSGYVSALSPVAFLAALGVFAAFGALSIGTWGYFRFRPEREAA